MPGVSRNPFTPGRIVPKVNSSRQRALGVIVLLTSIVCVGARGGDEPRHIMARVSMTFYVDSRNGDDGKVGTTPEASWKTLRKVNATTFLPGDRILLKSSSAWQ